MNQEKAAEPRPASRRAANAEPRPTSNNDVEPPSRVRVKSVLVSLHGRRAHLGALEMGRIIAGALRAPLHGLFVSREPIEASEVPSRVGVPPEALRGVVLDVATGSDSAAALTAAIVGESTAFVVVASEPDDVPDERLGIGALAARALQVATCGVVVISPAARARRLQRILLPLDGTPSTAAAITPAAELARALGAELDIVMVGGAHPEPARWPGVPVSPPSPVEHGAMAPPLYVDQPQHEWPAFSEEFIQRFVGAIGRSPPDVRSKFYLGAGEPASEILRFAGQLDSDLVVLVWHGQLSGHHGAVFRRVLLGATCPVLVLRR